MVIHAVTRHKESTSVVLTTLLSTEVRRSREGLRKALIGTVGIVDLRTPSLLLVHDAGVLELLDERLLAPETAQK